MAYKVIILYQLYMPAYFLGTFTEYPCLEALFLFLTLFLPIQHPFPSDIKATRLPKCLLPQ